VVTDGDELIGQGAFWEVLKEVFGVERPALKGVVPTASRSLAPVRDLTHLNCFSVDSAGARLKEDVFSVEPDVDKGGWTIGVHIANAARYVELGSTLDILARRLGKFDRVVSGGDRNLLFMLPLKILEAIDLGVNQPRETFSLLFSIDENLRIREGSQWLGLATVTNRNSYSRKQLDFNLAGRAPLPHFQLLERFARTDSTLFWTKEVDAPFVPAEAIVGGMVDIFNSYAARLLGEKGIALPRHHNRDSVELPYRFTGGGRIYTSLMAQRQLLAHLEDREPHSEQQVAAIVREIGVTLSESVAYRLFEYASGIWKDDVNAHVKLCSTGGVIKRRR
jgi:exoribonuclease R